MEISDEEDWTNVTWTSASGADCVGMFLYSGDRSYGMFNAHGQAIAPSCECEPEDYVMENDPVSPLSCSVCGAKWMPSRPSSDGR